MQLSQHLITLMTTDAYLYYIKSNQKFTQDLTHSCLEEII